MHIAYIIFIAVGAFIFILGCILYKTKSIEMLSGYDATKKYDRNGLAEFNGRNLMYMGSSIFIIYIIVAVISKLYTVTSVLTTSIFFIDVIFFSLKSIISSKKYELSEGRGKTKTQRYYDKTAIVAIIALLIIISSLVGGFVVEESHQTTVLTVNKIELNVKAGTVERFYDTSSIKNVYMKETIKDHLKMSGEGIGSIERGTYDVDGLGKGSIFLEGAKGPYLYVIMDNDFLIINNKDDSKTKQFYKELLKYKK